MEKHILRTVTITIIEIWTITWADGAEQTVVYRASQSCHVLPACPIEPQGWAELTTIATNSSVCAPVAQTDAREATGGTGGSVSQASDVVFQKENEHFKR